MGAGETLDTGRDGERREEEMRETERRETVERRHKGKEERRESSSFGEIFFIQFQPKEAVYRDSPFSPSEARRQTKMLCQLQKKINDDTVLESFSPFSADGTRHFLALIHFLSASAEAADILLSLKNQKENHLCFSLQLVPLHSLLQELPHGLAKPVGLKGKTSLGQAMDLGALSTNQASPPRCPGPHKASSL